MKPEGGDPAAKQTKRRSAFIIARDAAPFQKTTSNISNFNLGQEINQVMLGLLIPI
jgi:hypothetical protein